VPGLPRDRLVRHVEGRLAADVARRGRTEAPVCGMKYQILPNLTTDEMEALTADIRERGVMIPVELDDQGEILDGHHRVMIADSLGISYPTIVRDGWTEAQKFIHVVALNAHRRHLTSAQKRKLNDVLSSLVVEVVEHPKTGAEMRVGLSRKQRATDLGVGVRTIEAWDSDTHDGVSDPPTHIRLSTGRVQPAHTPRRTDRNGKAPRPAPLRKTRPIPGWSRHATSWLRSARPEDRDYLRRLDREIHAALERNGIPCEKEGAA
jgi:hypothetical protein